MSQTLVVTALDAKVAASEQSAKPRATSKGMIWTGRMLWLGLVLRDSRLRALLPFRAANE